MTALFGQRISPDIGTHRIVGEGIAQWRKPQTTYWWYADGVPVAKHNGADRKMRKWPIWDMGGVWRDKDG